MTILLAKNLEEDKRLYQGTGDGMRVLIYSHDTMGLGHLQRNLKIAHALKSNYSDLSVLMITGSSQADRFQFPPDVDYVKLPAVRKTGEEKYESKFNGTPFEITLRLRTSIMLQTVKEFKPHIFLVDHAPLGMKKEILPSLEWLKENSSNSYSILGLRDILDDPKNVKPLWRQHKIYDALNELYDQIFIYGTPEVYNPVTEYEFPPAVKDKTSFLGYITGYNRKTDSSHKIRHQISKEKKYLFVTIGGGEWMGETIIGNLLEALSEYKIESNIDSHILTGPFLPENLWRNFKEKSSNLPVKLSHFISNTKPCLKKSDLVLSSLGYNTATDIMSYARRAIVIPRMRYRKEQSIRAERLSKLGLFTHMPPNTVTSEGLYNSIVQQLNNEGNPLEEARRNQMIELGGTHQLVKVFNKLFARISNIKEPAL